MLILEKTESYGGNSALSGGGAWMPNAPELVRQGQGDDLNDTLAYLRRLAPDVDEARQRAIRDEGERAVYQETVSDPCG